MSVDTPDRIRDEHARLLRALAGKPSAEERASIKADIVTLFRRTEAMIAELATFKETIRELVERFKSLPGEAAVVSLRHDHLGASTFLERGWAALAVGDWTAAAVAFREAASLDATNVTARALLAWTLVHTGESDAAITLCRAVLAADPASALARVAIGMVLVRRDQLDDAAIQLAHVTAGGGDQRAVLYAHYWLGVIALKRGDQATAIHSLRRAVTLGPNLGEGWAELGTALWHSGAVADAREAWEVGAGIRHSPHAARCRELVALAAAGGTPPRWPHF